MRRSHVIRALAVALLGLAWVRPAAAQEVRIRDLTVADGAVPVRLVGYGLVVGLDGSGDRAQGTRGATYTVQSVANLLRRFNVEVPAEMLATRNAAAVLVTAEVSPYLRPGAHFEVQVSSLGDARSLRGGVLWMTPLVAEAGGTPYGTAQGRLVASEGAADRRRRDDDGDASVRIPAGGVVESDLPRPAFASSSRLLLREPNLGTAVRVAEAVNTALGAGTASVEDPGSIALRLPRGDAAVGLAKIGDLRVKPDRPARLVIDGRDGTVVAGGDLTVGEAVVSHGGVTLTVGGGAGGGGGQAPGQVRVAAGTPVQDVAAALHAVNAPAAEIAAIFESLREVGALAVEVVVR